MHDLKCPGGSFGGPGGGLQDGYCKSSGKSLLLPVLKSHPQDHQDHVRSCVKSCPTNFWAYEGVESSGRTRPDMSPGAVLTTPGLQKPQEAINIKEKHVQRRIKTL